MYPVWLRERKMLFLARDRHGEIFPTQLASVYCMVFRIIRDPKFSFKTHIKKPKRRNIF